MKAETIYTIGYQGKAVDAFWGLLERAGVDALVDTRAVPWSPRPQFARKALAYNNQVEYFGLPGLGIPSKHRKIAERDGRTRELLDRYETIMGHTTLETEPLRSLLSVFGVKARPCLLCCEPLPGDCHRGRLAGVLNNRLGLPVEHL